MNLDINNIITDDLNELYSSGYHLSGTLELIRTHCNSNNINEDDIQSYFQEKYCYIQNHFPYLEISVDLYNNLMEILIGEEEELSIMSFSFIQLCKKEDINRFMNELLNLSRKGLVLIKEKEKKERFEAECNWNELSKLDDALIYIVISDLFDLFSSIQKKKRKNEETNNKEINSQVETEDNDFIKLFPSSDIYEDDICEKLINKYIKEVMEKKDDNTNKIKDICLAVSKKIFNEYYQPTLNKMIRRERDDKAKIRKDLKKLQTQFSTLFKENQRIKNEINRLNKEKISYKEYYDSLIIRKSINYMIIKLFTKYYESFKCIEHNGIIILIQLKEDIQAMKAKEFNTLLDLLYKARDMENSIAHFEGEHAKGKVFKVDEMINIIESVGIELKSKDEEGKEKKEIVHINNLRTLFTEEERNSVVDFSFYDDELQKKYKEVIQEKKKQKEEKKNEIEKKD